MNTTMTLSDPNEKISKNKEESNSFRTADEVEPIELDQSAQNEYIKTNESNASSGYKMLKQCKTIRYSQSGIWKSASRVH